mgnify:CR=1 FL=1|jgi:hypothetical protein
MERATNLAPEDIVKVNFDEDDSVEERPCPQNSTSSFEG